MNVEPIVVILQMSVGPVIVISGVGLLLLTMTNRFGRVVDRMRILADTLRSGARHDPARITRELSILLRRARMLRLAIAFASTSVLVAASLVIVLFLAALMEWEAGVLIVVMFILCMGMLITSLCFLIVDVNASLAALSVEMDVTPSSGD